MAYITTAALPPGTRAGTQYTQSAGTSADATSADAIVPAVADHLAVIDNILLGSTAAEILRIRAGSDDLTGAIHTVALGSPIDVLPGNATLRSDTAGEAITIFAASSGAIWWTIWYHYEKVSH